MYMDYRCLYSNKQLKQFTQPVADFIQACQKRLHGRAKNLAAKGKHVNKVRCALARELCGFVWEYVVKVLPQLETIARAA